MQSPAPRSLSLSLESERKAKPRQHARNHTKARTLYDAKRVLDIIHDANDPQLWGDIFAQTHSSFSSLDREEFLSQRYNHNNLF